MNDTLQTPIDPLGCIERLRQVLAAPEWNEAQAGNRSLARRAAAELAVALGRCRLFGVVPPTKLNGTLKLPMVRDAALAWCEQLRGCILRAEALGATFDRTEEPLEFEAMAFDLLEKRMDVWAAWVAIDEGHDAAMLRDEKVALAISGELDELLALQPDFDCVLQQQAALLTPACETYLLDNWRNNLAPPYGEHLPWWLDGSLEALARKQVEVEETPRKPTPKPPHPSDIEVLLVVSRFVRPRIRLARMGQAQTETEETEAERTIRWRGAHGDRKALLILPAEVADAEEVVNVVFLQGKAPTDKLNGWHVRLAGVPAQIGDSVAKFKVGQLPAEEREAMLEVGDCEANLKPWFVEAS